MRFLSFADKRVGSHIPTCITPAVQKQRKAYSTFTFVSVKITSKVS